MTKKIPKHLTEPPVPAPAPSPPRQVSRVLVVLLGTALALFAWKVLSPDDNDAPPTVPNEVVKAAPAPLKAPATTPAPLLDKSVDKPADQPMLRPRRGRLSSRLLPPSQVR